MPGSVRRSPHVPLFRSLEVYLDLVAPLLVEASAPVRQMNADLLVEVRAALVAEGAARPTGTIPSGPPAAPGFMAGADRSDG